MNEYATIDVVMELSESIWSSLGILSDENESRKTEISADEKDIVMIIEALLELSFSLSTDTQAKLYSRLCEKNVKNFNDVPDNLKIDVSKLIELDGYVIDDDGTIRRKELNNED